MPLLNVMPEGRQFEFAAGESLLAVLLRAGLPVDNACGGRGVCGKCRVRVLGGDAGAVTDTERQVLRREDLDRGVRLACLVHPASDLTVELLHRDRRNDVLTSGYLPAFAHDVDFSRYAACEEPYGVAVDIGTTTVVCSLVDLRSGRETAAAAAVNAQVHFGQDVLSRITYEIEHPETGARQLQTAIVEALNGLVRTACDRAGVAPEQICEYAVSANTTMLHMLVGADARPIGTVPFTPAFTAAQDLAAAAVGLVGAPGARLYCLPSVSAYVGADIVAGAYVCDLRGEQGNVIFIDIGTNGEIVLASHGKLLACSCAAGPALEGMNISAGMRAADGAVEDVELTPDGLQLTVIGGGPPAGICGSGILAATRELLRTGIVRRTGAFVRADKFYDNDYRRRYLITDSNGRRSFRLTDGPEPLRITQGDIRQVQLAKGAILSGFTALLQRAGITMADLDKVVIAGQFGAHLPARSLTGTGILPFEVEDRIRYVGNTSATGAYMALLSQRVRREMEALARGIEYFELGALDHYEELLADCLTFPAVR